MGEKKREPEPNTLKNSELSPYEVPLNKDEGRTLEEKEREDLLKVISTLAAKVEDGVILEPDEKIKWEIMLVAKMTPKEKTQVIDRIKREAARSGDYQDELLRQYKRFFEISTEDKKKIEMLSGKESSAWQEKAVELIAAKKIGNFSRAYAIASATRSQKKGEDGYPLWVDNIQTFGDQKISFKSAGEKDIDSAADLIKRKLNGEAIK